MSTNQVFFRTDDAWDFIPEGHGLPMPVVEVREEAKGLRFITSRMLSSKSTRRNFARSRSSVPVISII
jgi:hypothetical protein